MKKEGLLTRQTGYNIEGRPSRSLSKERKPRLLVINPQPDQNLNPWKLGFYRDWVAEATGFNPHELDFINVAEGNPLPKHFDYDAIIGLGSGLMVTEKTPWMAETAEFIHKAEDAGIPWLGICFTHQLAADERGGKLEHKPTKRVGITRLNLTWEARRSPITKGWRGRWIGKPRFFTSHWEVAVERPSSTQETEVVSFAHAIKPEKDPNHILVYRARKGKIKGISLQFHPELRSPHALKLVGTPEDAAHKGLTPEDIANAIRDVEKYSKQVERNGRRLLANWLDYYVKPAERRKKRKIIELISAAIQAPSAEESSDRNWRHHRTEPVIRRGETGIYVGSPGFSRNHGLTGETRRVDHWRGVYKTPRDVEKLFGNHIETDAAAVLFALADKKGLPAEIISKAGQLRLVTVSHTDDKNKYGVVSLVDSVNKKIVQYLNNNPAPSGRDAEREFVTEATDILGDTTIQEALGQIPGQAVFVRRRDDGNKTYITIHTRTDVLPEIKLDLTNKVTAS